MPMSRTPATLPSVSQPAPLALWASSLWWVNRGREVSGLVYRWFRKNNPKVDSTTAPLWDIPERQWWKDISPVVCTSYNALGHALWKERWPDVWVYGVIGLTGWSGIWKERDWKSSKKINLRKRYVDRPLRIGGKKNEDNCVPCEYSPIGDLSKW